MSITAGQRTVHLWALREDVVLEPGEHTDQLVLTGPWGTERIESPGPVEREALRRMELGPVLLANLEAGTERTESRVGTYLVLLPLLTRLSHLLVRTLGLDDLGGPLLSVSPVSRAAPLALMRLSAGRPVRLPAGVSLSLCAKGFALESSESAYRVVLHRPEAVWVVAMLAWPISPADASAALPLPDAVTKSILDYLAAAGMASPVEVP
ncbi:NADH oxidase [Streptomyces sp. C11-1]|uniref:NADH oxidase n=1 Tax=Streptomyces durocortorensis TaxID=2811104 RepID=A0ABY9VVR4_9ACTN|nr:NADH oxidase [Streptomyces durocortorensis]WNF28031.1 NADH oxidase [Streptomyces durocortorensis]